MAISDIVVFGYGSWSTVNDLPTLGYTPSILRTGGGMQAAQLRSPGMDEAQLRSPGMEAAQLRSPGLDEAQMR